ncbi:MAG: DUF294 nucleotidyltransferase-like domain-containing protein [Magnetococcus sp. DMHC-1]|nr:hypothetical protein [Magnetococcales bacterium]
MEPMPFMRGPSRLLAILTSQDALKIQEIQQAATLATLTDLVHQQTQAVQCLLTHGVKVRHIRQIVRDLDCQVFQKVASLLSTPDMLEHLCILVMGSEGRGEQITKTDQDNALLTDDTFPATEITAFCQNFANALIRIGYPPCPGQVMLSNPEWSGNLADFQKSIFTWIRDPTPDGFMRLAICYDARPVAGNKILFQQAYDFFWQHLPDDPAFYAHFALPALAFATPLGVFKRFIVEKGERQGHIDLKKGASFPIVHGVRSLALEQRIRESSTPRRILGLMHKGILDRSFGKDLIAAFDFVAGLQVRNRLKKVRGEEAGEDFLLLNSLGYLEQEYLRNCFGLVDRFKKMIYHHFNLRILH